MPLRPRDDAFPPAYGIRAHYSPLFDDASSAAARMLLPPQKDDGLIKLITADAGLMRTARCAKAVTPFAALLPCFSAIYERRYASKPFSAFTMLFTRGLLMILYLLIFILSIIFLAGLYHAATTP